MAILWHSILSSHQCNQVLGIKIFGFDFSSLRNLRFPQPRPAYQHRPTYQQIPEPPPPQIDSLQNSASQISYRQPEYNSVYSDQFVSHPQTKQDIYNSGIEEPQSYVENQAYGNFQILYFNINICSEKTFFKFLLVKYTFVIIPNIFADYQYDYRHSELPSYSSEPSYYDTQVNTEKIYRQDVQELPPSPVYIPSQHSAPIYTTETIYTPPPSTNNNHFQTLNAHINVSIIFLV